MKIDKPVEPLPVTPASGERPTTRPAPPPPRAAQDDSVSLSERSRDLRRLGAELASQPAFDAAKVEAIKAAIASGTFKVDPGKVADGLIASVADLLARRAS